MLDIKFVDWMVKDNKANKMFAISLWDGRLIFNVKSTADRQAQPLVRRRVTFLKVHMLVKVIEKIMQASPETKIPIKFSVFDKPSGQWKLDWVLTFEKDPKMCYRVHITDVASSQTHVFALRGPSDVSVGADVMSDADKSVIMMHDLKLWLEEARRWAPATVRPFDPSKKGGNGGGNWKGNGGGYNRGGGGNWGNRNGGGNGGGGGSFGGGNGGGSAPAATTGGGEDDGLPF